MGILDKMGIKRKREKFIPGCKFKEDGTASCKYVWERSDGLVETPKAPVEGRIVAGKFEPFETGDASDAGIKRLKQHFEDIAEGK